MNKLLPSILIAAILTACGGGGNDSSVSPSPATSVTAPATTPVATPVTAPATTPATTPAAGTSALVEVPAVPSNAMNLTVGTFNNGSSGGNYLVKFSGATNLNLTGNLNSMWISAAQSGGSVTVDGASNTLVFQPTSTPTTVAVGGSANTFYLPQGSAITLTGNGAAMSTVKYYKP